MPSPGDAVPSRKAGTKDNRPARTVTTKTAPASIHAAETRHSFTWWPITRIAAAARSGVHDIPITADYVRSDIDLATMEGANARLDAAKSTKPRCTVQTLYRPPEFELLKVQDGVNYGLGLPN